MYVYRNIELCSCKHCCREKALGITNSVYVFVSSVIQHVKRMRRIILLFVAFLAAPYSPTLYHKRSDFRKHILNLKYVFSFLYKLCMQHFLF
jgi:hypothetical protein